MASLTKAAFLSKWASLFADNGTRQISAQDMRDFREDIADSFINSTDTPITNAYVDCGTYDASSDLFPDEGTATGTGTAGVILRGNTFDITVSGTLGSQFVPAGSTLRALVDAPGQTESNWRIYF